jgi:hypothetical protein
MAKRLISTDPIVVIGNLFEADHFQALALLDSMNKVAGLLQGIEGSRAQPGRAQFMNAQTF